MNQPNNDTTTNYNDPEFAEPPNLKVACVHLRHKLMYCDDRHATPGLVDDSSGTRTFYRVQTQQAACCKVRKLPV